MTARWDRLPPDTKKVKPRRKPRKGVWRCHTCGALLDGTWAAAERHADTHGGARLDCVDAGTLP